MMYWYGILAFNGVGIFAALKVILKKKGRWPLGYQLLLIPAVVLGGGAGMIACWGAGASDRIAESVGYTLGGIDGMLAVVLLAVCLPGRSAALKPGSPTSPLPGGTQTEEEGRRTNDDDLQPALPPADRKPTSSRRQAIGVGAGVVILLGIHLLAVLAVGTEPKPKPPPDKAILEIEKMGGKVEGGPELHSVTRVKFSSPGRADLAPVKGMAQLQELDLTGCRVNDADLVHLKGLGNLRVLLLDATQVTNDGLEHVEGLSRLETLTLSRTQVSGGGLWHLKGLTGLKKLSLHDTRVFDAPLANLEEMARLEELELGITGTTDAGLEHLKKIKTLKRLDLAATGVTDAGLAHLKEMTNLEQLNLRETEVTDTGRLALKAALPKCEILPPP
jgi:hypothetical protein